MRKISVFNFHKLLFLSLSLGKIIKMFVLSNEMKRR